MLPPTSLLLTLLALAQDPASPTPDPSAVATVQPAVRNVAVLVYDGVELLDFAGPAEVFTIARGEDGSRFRVFTVAAAKDPVVSQGFLTITPEHTFASAPRADLVVVPGGGVPLTEPPVVEWVRTAGSEAEVALSVCNGALLFAKAGLLEGREATTHHGSIERLRIVSPTTTVRPELRFVDNGGVVTTAGVSAGIDGSLQVVSRLLGHAAAQRTAEYMEYRWDPDGAAEYHRRAFAAEGRPGVSRLVKVALTEGVEAGLAAWDSFDPVPTEADVNRAGYALLQGAERPEAALVVLELNTRRFATSANAWDSRAEVLEALGRGEEALASARRCLDLIEGDGGLDPAFALRLREANVERVERLTSSTPSLRR